MHYNCFVYVLSKTTICLCDMTFSITCFLSIKFLAFFKKFLLNFFLLFDYFSDVPYATSR